MTTAMRPQSGMHADERSGAFNTRNSLLFLTYVTMCMTAAVLFAACSKDNKNGNGFNYGTIQPKGSKPDWGPDITGQMQAVIEALDSLQVKPISTLTVQQARTQPTPADAVMLVMKEFSVPTPAMNVDTAGRDIPVENGTIHARVYTPKTGKSVYPVIVYYHGGGWVIATIDTYNRSAQALAEKTDAVVVSVEYRKGPENRFPTAHNDAYAAYVWSLQNASQIKGDSTKIAVAGESAGGNLAVNVSMMARDNGIRKPVYQVIVYPVASNDPTLDSKMKYTSSKPLATPDLSWFLNYYLSSPEQAADTRINLLGSIFTGLPPATVIGAELDPLQTEGKKLADAIGNAGAPVHYQLYTGVTHEFFGMDAVVPEAKAAQDAAVADLKNAFK